MGKVNASSTSSTLSTVVLNDATSFASSMPNIIYNDTSETYIELPAQNESNLQSWNYSTIAVALPENLPTTINASRSTVYTPTTTLDPFDEFGPPEGVEYIFVPLGVVVFVIILSAVVLIVSRKRKLERLRHRLMPMYNFDPGEEEEDDWETELLDECHSNYHRRQGYQSMDTEENAELFGTFTKNLH